MSYNNLNGYPVNQVVYRQQTHKQRIIEDVLMDTLSLPQSQQGPFQYVNFAPGATVTYGNNFASQSPGQPPFVAFPPPPQQQPPPPQHQQQHHQQQQQHLQLQFQHPHQQHQQLPHPPPPPRQQQQMFAQQYHHSQPPPQGQQQLHMKNIPHQTMPHGHMVQQGPAAYPGSSNQEDLALQQVLFQQQIQQQRHRYQHFLHTQLPQHLPQMQTQAQPPALQDNRNHSVASTPHRNLEEEYISPVNSDNQTPQQPQLQPQLLKYSQARPTSTGSTLPRKVVTNESAGDDFEIFSFLANDVSLGHEFKDDITSLLDDSLIDMKNSAPSSPSHFEKLAQGREVKPQEPVGLLQKMAEFDEANSDIFSDLILGNNYPKTSVLDSPNLSTANSTPTNVAGHTSTPESLILYGNGNNNSANSSVGQAAKYADQEKNNINLTLSDFESSGESTDNIDPRRVKLTSKGSASPADLFEFEVNKSSTSVSSLSNMNDMKSPKAISDLSKFKKLLPPNSPIVKSERRNSGGQLSLNPLSPNKVSKSTFSKSLVAPIRPYGVDNSRPRSPSNSKRPGSKQNDTLTSPANSIRKVKSTLNTHALSSSNLTNGNVLSTMKIKPQNPKARRTFSFNQCSSTLDFSKNYMAPATGDANLGNCNKLGAGNEVNGNALPMQGQQNIAPTPPSNFKVYSFVIDPHTTSSVSESHQKEKMSGLSLNINTGHEMPGHNMMVPSDLISPTLSLKSPNLESPMMHTPLSATFPGHFPLGKGTSYIDNTIKPSKKLKNMESGMTEFQLKLKKI